MKVNTLIARLLAASGASAAITNVFQKGDSGGYVCYRIPALLRAANGDLLTFVEARNAPGCDDNGNNDIAMRRSTDNGRSWNAANGMLVLNGGAENDWGNPVPILTDTGRIVLVTVRHPADTLHPKTVHVQWSDDNGVEGSWTDPTVLSLDDMPAWGHFATGPGGGIQLSRGIHAGRLVVGINFSEESSGHHGAGVIYSDDNGETWHAGATDIITDGSIRPQELSLFERTDGRIYAMARENEKQDPENPRVAAIFSDGGATLDQPFEFVRGLPGRGGVQGAVLRLRASDQGDKYNRILYSAPIKPNAREDMMIRSSFDEGATWQSQTDGTRITTKRAAYSDMKIINDDEIGLVYEGGELGDAGAANDAIRFAYFPESDLGLPDDYSGGTSTPDKSGLDNSAFLRGTGGSLSSDGGRWGGAVSLDGSSSYVQVPFAESLAVGAGDFTFSTWINYGRSSTAEQTILWAYGQGDNHSQLWVRALPGDDRIRAWLQNRGTSAILDSPSAYVDQQWHHLVVRRSGSEGTMFVDGEQVNSTSIEFGTVSPGRPFQLHIGQRLDGQNRFHGLIDETRLYRRALSDEEIGSLYDTNANIDDELVLQLAFDRTG